MKNNKISLKEAVKFHGHLGPYLVLGLSAGELALSKLNCRKYFGLGVKVYGAIKKPKSCLIDGLQLSSGATYGKGNILKFNGPAVKIEFKNLNNNKKIILRLKDRLRKQLKEAKTYQEAELLARRLYDSDYSELFRLTTIKE
jgi:formylmethanofuran dehydrogenase subunit E